MLGVMTRAVDTMRLLALVALVLLSTVGDAAQRYQRGLSAVPYRVLVDVKQAGDVRVGLTLAQDQ